MQQHALKLNTAVSKEYLGRKLAQNGFCGEGWASPFLQSIHPPRALPKPSWSGRRWSGSRTWDLKFIPNKLRRSWSDTLATTWRIRDMGPIGMDWRALHLALVFRGTPCTNQ